MRKYDDPVEVRKGLVGDPGVEGPEQFLWRGRLWKVREVVAHWVETGAWWQGSTGPGADLLAEREMWRVAAGDGAAAARGDRAGAGAGVFDLAFDWTDGRWQLVGCLD